ncbi:fatty acid-binding protein, adipocyte-like [Carassius gibelio]|uniref:fatty acid-binding protein, adipocyte-like n=1 Tax=Carassius gibelio TaxID=101364 RepID=UPI0022788A40|nr:fatty acid-binding protein, adipocyte-like [Carassius gibelio]
MVEQFVGKWKMTSSDNFDEYMKAVGAGFASRQMANLAKPSLAIAVDEQGLVSMKAVTTFKTLEIKFQFDEEFDETTADDRTVRTTMSLVDGKLIQKQTWEGKTTIIEREILFDCFIGEEGCAALISALRSNPSHLTELNLSCNKPGDSGVKLLSALLEDPHCKLKKLNSDPLNSQASF